MSSIYDRTDIYDLLEDQTHWSAYKKTLENVVTRKECSFFFRR